MFQVIFSSEMVNSTCLLGLVPLSIPHTLIFIYIHLILVSFEVNLCRESGTQFFGISRIELEFFISFEDKCSRRCIVACFGGRSRVTGTDSRSHSEREKI